MEAPVSRPVPLPAFPVMVLMLGLLSCVAPATIDAYLPAFGALGREFGVPQDTVQLTLGVYMFCYAAMLLLHGTLSDSLGRRRVVLTALVCYVAGALLAAAAPDFGWLLAARALQGLSAGAGIVVGQAIVRDCYEGAVARRAMSYLILVFNLSPALAPIVGGYLARTRAGAPCSCCWRYWPRPRWRCARCACPRPWLRNSASPCPGAAWPGTTAGCWATRASCRWGWPSAWSSPPRAS